jgi:hypothetical protein
VIKISQLFVMLMAIFLVSVACSGNASSQTPIDTSHGTQPISSGSPLPSAIQLRSLTAQEIAINSMNTIKSIKTFKFDMEFIMVFGSDSAGQINSMNMKQSGTAAIDIPDKKMAMTMNMVMDMPDKNQQNMTADIYTSDHWLYMKANVPGMGDQWTKMELTDEVWEKQSQISNMTDFLKSPINLELIDSEKVRDIDCYVVNITPDQETLAKWMTEQSQNGQNGLNMNNQNLSQSFNNFILKEWISKDNFFPVRMQIMMEFDNNSGSPEATPNSLSQMKMKMNMNSTIDYYDFNKTLTIQLPAEALNAQDITPRN